MSSDWSLPPDEYCLQLTFQGVLEAAEILEVLASLSALEGRAPQRVQLTLRILAHRCRRGLPDLMSSMKVSLLLL